MASLNALKLEVSLRVNRQVFNHWAAKPRLWLLGLCARCLRIPLDLTISRGETEMPRNVQQVLNLIQEIRDGKHASVAAMAAVLQQIEELLGGVDGRARNDGSKLSKHKK